MGSFAAAIISLKNDSLCLLLLRLELLDLSHSFFFHLFDHFDFLCFLETWFLLILPLELRHFLVDGFFDEGIAVIRWLWSFCLLLLGHP